MIFLGAFMSADELSLSATPTNVTDIMSITVKDTVLDTLYGTQDTDFEITEEIPTKWDFDTVLNATYDTSTAASNVEWTLDTVSHLIIKRKKKDDFDWTIIEVKPISKLEDFMISNMDITPTTGDYIYAVVPTLNGVEGAYTTVDVPVLVNKLCLTDITGTWSTFFTDGSCNVTWSTPGTFQTTLNSRYPTYIANTIASYQTISVAGEFYPTEDYCNMDLMFDDEERVKYLNEFLLFLNNRKPKVLKNVDGRRWLVMVNDGVTDNMKEFYKEREVTFSCTEIGDCDSTEDLTTCGITDIPIEFW